MVKGLRDKGNALAKEVKIIKSWFAFQSVFYLGIWMGIVYFMARSLFNIEISVVLILEYFIFGGSIVVLILFYGIVGWYLLKSMKKSLKSIWLWIFGIYTIISLFCSLLCTGKFSLGNWNFLLVLLVLINLLFFLRGISIYYREKGRSSGHFYSNRVKKNTLRNKSLKLISIFYILSSLLGITVLCCYGSKGFEQIGVVFYIMVFIFSVIFSMGYRALLFSYLLLFLYLCNFFLSFKVMEEFPMEWSSLLNFTIVVMNTFTVGGMAFFGFPNKE